jgi:hypothetical protein
MKHIFLFPIRHFSIKYISIFVFKYLLRERDISAKSADGYPSEWKIPMVFFTQAKVKSTSSGAVFSADYESFDLLH